jgi:putative flippase GtrA
MVQCFGGAALRPAFKSLGSFMHQKRRDTAMPDDKLQWLGDVTIPDWTRVTPNQNLGDKKWRVRNIGTTAWGEGYVLVHDWGDQMGAPDSVPLPALAPNQEGEVTVPSIVAPSTQGIHKTSWIPRNATGKPFMSNLTIVIDVNPIGEEALLSPVVAAVAQELDGYGITFFPDNWEDVTAQRVRDLIVQVGQRFYDFAVQQIPADVLKSPQEIFRLFFPRRVLRRNLANEKLFNCTDPHNPATCSKAYAWNDGTSITFYSNAIFTGTRKVRNQSPHARFAVTFTTEFLVLHELCHSYYWSDVYAETSQPLVEMVAAALPNHNHYNVESATIASAGFKQGARSQNNHAEFSTDAIANWCQEGFTGPADGDNEGFGDFRRNQLDTMVSNWLGATYGPSPH